MWGDVVWGLTPGCLILTQSNNMSAEDFMDSRCQSTKHSVEGGSGQYGVQEKK